LLREEIATLETLAQFGRVEPDRGKIATEVEKRLAIVRERLAGDPALAELSPEDRNLSSGEARALQWALGRDRLTQDTQEWLRETAPDPVRLARRLPTLLTQALRESSDPGARASAAYDLGKLHFSEAIPALVQALEDRPEVAETALGALCAFDDNELLAAGLDREILERISAARPA
jgi:hypothetical protein